MMQESIVAVIVAVSAWVVVKRFTPPAWQRAIGGWSAGVLRKVGRPGLAERLEARAARRSGSGAACGSCGNCGPSEKGAASKQFVITPEALKRTAAQRSKP
jgi:hypothetical protein